MATILIAEDNSDLRKLVNLQLKQHGFAIVEATNGNQVLELLKSEKIDLILMDMNMPELDGWEATLAVRMSGDFASVPIIAMTAYSLDGDKERAKAAGCNAFHSKPLEFELLQVDINRLLQPKENPETPQGA